MQIIRFNEVLRGRISYCCRDTVSHPQSPTEKRAVPHFQRFKDALLHEGFIGLTGHDLDDASEDREARTAVGPPTAGREIQGLPAIKATSSASVGG